MKKSEELKQKGNEEENDLIAMGHYNKALREKRSENFEEKWLKKIKDHSDIVTVLKQSEQGKYVISHKVIGFMDLYPKANKLLIRSKNKWKKPGLRWLIKLLNIHENEIPKR